MAAARVLARGPCLHFVFLVTVAIRLPAVNRIDLFLVNIVLMLSFASALLCVAAVPAPVLLGNGSRLLNVKIMQNEIGTAKIAVFIEIVHQAINVL